MIMRNTVILVDQDDRGITARPCRAHVR